jgi:hypothetical protein
MIAFGFGRAVSLDAGMPAGFRHQSRAVCRSPSKLSRAMIAGYQRQSPIQRLLQL